MSRRIRLRSHRRRFLKLKPSLMIPLQCYAQHGEGLGANNTASCTRMWARKQEAPAVGVQLRDNILLNYLRNGADLHSPKSGDNLLLK